MNFYRRYQIYYFHQFVSISWIFSVAWNGDGWAKRAYDLVKDRRWGRCNVYLYFICIFFRGMNFKKCLSKNISEKGEKKRMEPLKTFYFLCWQSYEFYKFPHHVQILPLIRLATLCGGGGWPSWVTSWIVITPSHIVESKHSAISPETQYPLIIRSNYGQIYRPINRHNCYLCTQSQRIRGTVLIIYYMHRALIVSQTMEIWVPFLGAVEFSLWADWWNR